MPSCRNYSPSQGTLRQKTLPAIGPNFGWQSRFTLLVWLDRAVRRLCTCIDCHCLSKSAKPFAGKDIVFTMPSVSVIVPHYNDPIGLDRCLTALEQQSYPRQDFTIIVADNNSPQGLDAIAAVIAGRAELVYAPERGAGPARNAAVAASMTPLLAFIDSDCVADPQWLSAGIAGLDHFDFCGGPVNVYVDGSQPWSSVQAFEMAFAFDNRSYVKKKGFTVTATLFMRRQVFDTVGGFRVGVSEDLEWSHRATSHGFRLGFVDKAVIWHPARSCWPALRSKWLRIHTELYALKPPTLAHRLNWLVKSCAMPISIVVHTPRIFTHPRLGTAANRWAAFRGLVQLRLWRLWDGLRLVFNQR